MSQSPWRVAVPAAIACLSGFASAHAQAAPRVGPAHGTVIVVGGGSMGPEIYQTFITAAGGPDALIIDIPTAGGDSTYAQDDPSASVWRAAGARNVVVLHTTDRKVADSDSLAHVIAKAGGVWFEGGRQFHLVDSYAGTRTEAAFHAVLDRGGVIGGSSAGATILGDFLVRGAPSNDNTIMDDPRYEKGFAFLRGVGIDQHVVARERLTDLADSIMPRHPELLGMSEDEGTAWVIRRDTARIIGRDKAFAYGGAANDDRKPFLTLHPGDWYDLRSRTVIRRAKYGLLTHGFFDTLFAGYRDAAQGGATVLVAKGGQVLIDASYGIPDQPKYMPTTTVPQFLLGSITDVFKALCAELSPPLGGRTVLPPTRTRLQTCIATRISTPIGMHKTTATTEGVVQSDVDELYRLALGLEHSETYRAADTARAFDINAGWQHDRMYGTDRYRASGTADGHRAAFVRMPEMQFTVIILTNDDHVDASAMADQVLRQMFRSVRD
ncbi:MAG TPA: cyanophycinase [Gemmatimonadales bacterium]|nr:cyanophycinase [Gemmatimonadales bacterium]